MTAYIVLEIETKEECLDDMRKMLTTNMPQALAFDGCISVELVENDENRCNLVFFEKWKSREHYERYFQWRAETGVLEAFSAMLKQPPSFRFFHSYDT